MSPKKPRSIHKLWSEFQNDKIKLTQNFLVDFSLKWPEKVEFSISVIIEKCMGQKLPNTRLT